MMNIRGANTRRVLAGLAVLIAGVAIGVWLIPHGPAPTPDTGGRAILYWYDPMVPDQHFDKPGKSPFMDMQLAPRYADEAAAGGVQIDPTMMQNLGVRLVTIEKGPLAVAVRAAGVIDYNGRDIAVVQARQGGFVAKTHRRAPGDIVAAGDPIVDLRIPEWTAALAEYLALRKGDSGIATAARQRLTLLGVPEAAIAAATPDSRAPDTFTVRAPISGAITALDVREGMSVAPGAAIATINGLSPVWLTVAVPQGAAGPVQPGGRATARLSAFPGEAFEGRIEAVLPAANAASRAVEVRIALANPSGRLRPGMTGDVELTEAQPREALLVPSEAVIRTGQRTLVLVADDAGRYEPVEIIAGARSGEQTEIVSGLGAGQKVVASGQFLIDSEASLAGVVARLSGGAADDATPFEGRGRITALDDTGVTLAHGPVAGLNWPAMTMAFRWGQGERQSLAVGDEVAFSFHKKGADYVIDTIRPVEAKP